MLTLRVQNSIQKCLDSIPDDYEGEVFITVPAGIYEERVELRGRM